MVQNIEVVKKMSKTNKKESLADRIAKVLNTAPATLDPEDELADETRAKLNTDTTEDDDFDDELLSKFRKQNVDLLADIDEKYAGKKASRKNLVSSDESDDDQEESESGDNSDDENMQSPEENEDESDQKNSESDTDEGSEGSGSDFENSTLDETEHNSNFEHIKSEDVPLQLKKGMCVRNQLSIWESLLEMRIQIQKCLAAANRMPRKEKFKEIKAESGQEFSNRVSETAGSVSMLLGKLIDLQSLVLNKYPETKKFMKNDGKIEDPGDEEIPSDTDEDIPEEDSDVDAAEQPTKRRKLADFETEIGKQHLKYKDYRNSVIRKWHDKTTISIMKSNSSQYSVINNIEHTLKDKSKLVKRTQLKRTDYKSIGEEEIEPVQNESSDTKPTGEYNPEIFDDNDFYHQLLRELIEVKSSDITDPVQLGRQWIQLQNMRSKMKRKIDTRATKGRKTRYVVHPKLVSYLAPIEGNAWTDESKIDLCSSLFGKNQKSST
ncbi:protein AATF [Leptinotarsa decemlineata]|uniref:protein AATF n=1 Tax=Leptinotarsa decemlineata TaxID=7539 RepID=UPI003D30984D